MIAAIAFIITPFFSCHYWLHRWSQADIDNNDALTHYTLIYYIIAIRLHMAGQLHIIILLLLITPVAICIIMFSSLSVGHYYIIIIIILLALIAATQSCCHIEYSQAAEGCYCCHSYDAIACHLIHIAAIDTCYCCIDVTLHYSWYHAIDTYCYDIVMIEACSDCYFLSHCRCWPLMIRMSDWYISHISH